MTRFVTLAAIAIAAAAAAGCGGDDDSGGGKTTQQGRTTKGGPAPSGGATVKLAMSEFKFAPRKVGAKPGVITITTSNKGKTRHELLLLKRGTDPSKLPKKNGKAVVPKTVARIAPVKPGATVQTRVKLRAGSYGFICNLPGHYQAGMFGTLTVK